MIHFESVRRLTDWIESNRRSIAVLTGPRRIGKLSVTRAVERLYGCCLEIRMENSMSARTILSGCPCMREFIRRVEEHFGIGGI